MAIDPTIEQPGISSWNHHQLRLAFFDFSVRGEGESATIAAVVERWRMLGGLSDAEAGLWLDAIEWRRMGRFLPGWTVPAGLLPEGQAPCDEDYAAFLRWRTAPRQRAARVPVAAMVSGLGFT